MRQGFRLFCITALLLGIYHTGWMVYHADAGATHELALRVEPKRPKIPTRPKPRVPQIPREVKAEAPKVVAVVKPAQTDPEKRLLASINSAVSKPAISAADIQRGWYQAEYQEKKIGTPPNWRFAKSESGPLWGSEDAIRFFERREKETLCRSTGGTFRLSCLETETASCEAIEASRCDCSEGTTLKEGDGCLQIDEAGAFVPLPPQALSRGWYEGLMTEKKRGTPSHWIWNPLLDPPRWQNNLKR